MIATIATTLCLVAATASPEGIEATVEGARVLVVGEDEASTADLSASYQEVVAAAAGAVGVRACFSGEFLPGAHEGFDATFRAQGVTFQFLPSQAIVSVGNQ